MEVFQQSIVRAIRAKIKLLFVYPSVTTKGMEINPKDYQDAKPFPHLVIDDFLREDLAREIMDAFPAPDQARWWKYDNFLEKKLACNDWMILPDAIERFIHYAHTGPFIDFLENITGISGLIPDPHLNGGGLHQIVRGGKLDIHADYNYHPKTKLDRRLNVIFYLNEDWKPEWKGYLELWDKEMKTCIRSIAPRFNRMVIFSTTDFSYHGHPDPLECPEDITRKSIALYFYSNGRPESEKSPPHSTIFKKRPQDVETPEQAEFREKRSKGRL